MMTNTENGANEMTNEQANTMSYDQILEAINGHTFTDRSGIQCKVEVQHAHAKYPYPHTTTRIFANPTTKGKRTEAYREIRRKLRDDWSTDLTQSPEAFGHACNWILPRI